MKDANIKVMKKFVDILKANCNSNINIGSNNSGAFIEFSPRIPDEKHKSYFDIIREALNITDYTRQKMCVDDINLFQFEWENTNFIFNETSAKIRIVSYYEEMRQLQEKLHSALNKDLSIEPNLECYAEIVYNRLGETQLSVILPDLDLYLPEIDAKLLHLDEESGIATFVFNNSLYTYVPTVGMIYRETRPVALAYNGSYYVLHNKDKINVEDCLMLSVQKVKSFTYDKNIPISEICQQYDLYEEQVSLLFSDVVVKPKHFFKPKKWEVTPFFMKWLSDTHTFQKVAHPEDNKEITVLTVAKDSDVYLYNLLCLLKGFKLIEDKENIATFKIKKNLLSFSHTI